MSLKFLNNATFAGNVESQDTFILNYNNAGNKWQQLFDGSNGWNLRYNNGSSWSSNYINVNTSGNATFSGDVTVSGGDVGIGGTAANPTHGTVGVKLDLKGGTDSLIIMRGTTASTEYGLYSYNGDFMITRTNQSTWWNSPDFKLNSGNATFAGDVSLADSKKLILGAGSDLQIYHNNSNDRGYIYNATGNLYIENDATDGDILFYSDDGSGGTAQYFRVDGSLVETGFLKTTHHYDNVQARFGDAGDLRIYHDGSNSYITDTGTGFLNISSDAALVLSNAAGEPYFIGTSNGSVKLYYDNSTKLETTSAGVTVTGGWVTSGVSVAQANVEHTDNVKSLFGNGNDLEIYHNGSNSYINQTGTGKLILDTASTGINIQSGTGETRFTKSGANSEIKVDDASQANKVVLKSSGNSYLNGGNVGIGTTSPVAKLDVLGTSGGPVVFDYAYVTNAGLRIHGDESAMDIVGTDNGNHASTILLRNGNEGFGLLNNPNLNTLQFRSFTATADNFNIHNTGSGLSSLVDIITLEKSGNVGIGTTSPDVKLHIVGDGDRLEISSADYDLIKMGAYGDSGADLDNGFLNLSLDGSEKIRLLANGTSYFNGGNVGIGTTSPSEKLEVVGNIRIDSTSVAQMYLDSAANNDAVLNFQEAGVQKGKIGYDTSLAGLALVTGSGPFSSADMVVLNSGNVGIGDTSPTIISANTSSLSVNSSRTDLSGGLISKANGTVKHQQYWDSTGYGFSLSANSGNFKFTGGNVGIGTTSPGKKLHVVESGTNNTAIFENSGQTYSSTAIKVSEAVNNRAILSFAVGDALASTDIQAEIAGVVVNDGGTLKGDLTFKTNVGDNLQERMRIDSSGVIKFNAYDGTNNTGSPTHILGTDASGNVVKSTAGSSIGPWLPLAAGSGDPLTGDLYLKTTNDASIAREKIIWQTSQGTNRSFIRVGGSYASNDLEFGTGDSTLGMILHANAGLSIGATVATTLPPASGLLVQGNVGIGTTSPNQKLQVGGNLHVYDEEGDTDASIFISTGTSNVTTVKIASNGNSFFNAGNVGIGTTSPTHKLTVNAPNDTTAVGIDFPSAHFDFAANSTSGYTTLFKMDNTGLDIGHDSDGRALNLKTGNLDRVTILGNGNVGIGTTSPGAKLDVAGDVTATANYTSGNSAIIYKAQRSGGAVAGDWSYDDATTDMSLGTSTAHSFSLKTGNTRALTLNSSQNATFAGSVLVNGTNVTVANATNPYVYLNDTNAGAAIFQQEGNTTRIGSDSNTQVALVQNNATAVTIDTGKNVGIGTTSPTARLDILTSSATGDNDIDRFVRFRADNGEQRFAFSVGRSGNNSALQMYDSSEAQKVNIASGGNSYFNGGNVGIGTDSPGDKLEISGVANYTGLTIKGIGASRPALTFKNVSQSLLGAIYGTEGRAIVFESGGNGTTGVTAMTIDSLGKVGIGTTSPGAKLEVDSSTAPQILVKNTAGGDAKILLEDGSGVTQNASITFNESGQNTLTIATGYQSPSNANRINIAPAGHVALTAVGGSGGTSATKIGIGTTSPSAKLDVTGNYGNVIKAVSGSQSITTSFVAPSTGSGLNNIISTAGEFNIGTSDAQPFSLATSSISRVSILSGGNVGIGTTNPVSKLEVNGGADAIATVTGTTTAARLDIKTNSYHRFLQTIESDGRFRLYNQTTSTEQLTVTNAGNVGIGTTSPNYKLEVNGTLGVNRTDGIIFAGSAAAGMGNKITADASNDLIFSTSLPSAPYTVSEKMRIANNGATIFTSTVTATNFILSSDERLKENVEKVCDNRVKADWKTFELKTEKGQKRYGVIAQELEKTNPEFVREDSQGFKSVAYIDLLIAKIAELEARLEKLEK